MGYDVHITRAPKWHGENEGHEIPEEEWLAIVESDPELRPATTDDVYYWDGMVVWSGNNYEGAWLTWDRGDIFSKNPNVAMVSKMLELAEKLKARVQGDDWEVYLQDGRVLRDDGSFMDVDWRARDERKEPAMNKEKPWWRIW